MDGDVYLLRERKEANLDAFAVPKGVALTEEEAKKWCRECPEDVSARIFDGPLPLISSGGGDSPVSAVAESYTAFQWRDEPPTEPGYYWYANPRHAKTILCVFEHDGGLFVETSNGVSSHPGLHDGEWAGPIPEPVAEAESTV